jgi:ceramide glucosyltransferase
MTSLVVLSSIGVAASLLYYAAASATAIRFAARAASPHPALPKIAPPVAILKPLRGLSETLAANILSFLEARYPRAEFIFGVSDYEDRAAEIPVALKPRYQFANITLVVGEEAGCSNGKIAKLIKMAERARKAEIFVLSDADVSVDREHIVRVVSELVADERTAIVTCVYRARPLDTLASRLEALCVNTDFAPMAILSAAIEPMRHAFGATIAIKRVALEAIGGFRPLKDRLADDFFLGRMVAERGYQVKLSSSIVTVACEEHMLADFWNHQLRWARTYRSVRPVSLATIVIHGPFWALILLAASGFAPVAWGALAIVLGARVAMGALLLARVLRLPELMGDVWLIPLKDLMMSAIWFAGLFGSKVQWGERRFQILAGGAMREVKN